MRKRPPSPVVTRRTGPWWHFRWEASLRVSSCGLVVAYGCTRYTATRNLATKLALR